MRYLFLFAHPDDETVACAGTIKQLTELGNEVFVVHATDGGAGEVVTPTARKRLKEVGSVAALRQAEMAAVVEHLQLAGYETLDFPDGTITNEHVWGSLKEAMIEVIDRLWPDVMITFDHTGWYYHLDHVGVSIAATLAYQQAAHQPQALLFSHFRPTGTQTKWRYVFPLSQPITHAVHVADKQHKLQTMDKHESQNLGIPKDYVESQEKHQEFYELALASAKARLSCTNTPSSDL